jgi:hypothetical protein
MTKLKNNKKIKKCISFVYICHFLAKFAKENDLRIFVFTNIREYTNIRKYVNIRIREYGYSRIFAGEYSRTRIPNIRRKYANIRFNYGGIT